MRLGAAGENGVSATVSGSDAAPYLVTIDWSDAARAGVLVVDCDCPRFADSYFCKHLWAVVLAVDAAGHGVPGAGRLALIAADDDEANDDDADGNRLEGWDWDRLDPIEREAIALGISLRPFRLPPKPPAAPPPPLPSWRHQLRDVARTLALARDRAHRQRAASGDELPRRNELWLEIELSRTRASGELTVHLFQRQELRSGDMGALKPLTLNDQTSAALSEPEDRGRAALARALPRSDDDWRLQYGGGYGTAHPGTRTFRVPAALFPTVLPRLAAGGRLGWWDAARERPDPDRRLAWDDGPPWRLVLRLRRDREAGGAVLGGELVRDGETVGLAEPVLLLAAGLVLFTDRLARLETGDDFAWLAALRQRPSLAIPEEEVAAAVRELAALPSLPPLRIDEDLPVEHESPPPQPVLALDLAGASEHGPGAAVRGRLDFEYGDVRVPAGDPRSVLLGGGDDLPFVASEPAAAVRVLARDREAEAAARRRLLELGATPGAAADQLFLPADRLEEAAAHLIDAGWRLEARGRRLRRAGGLQLSVATGIDWFDLSGRLVFGGEAVGLPRLLAALRRGEDTVELADGSLGMLPSGWRERLAALAGLGSPAGAEGDDGAASLRFLPSQALLLDALLAAASAAAEAEIQVDHGFARLRDRLARGHELTAADQPEGFRGELRAYQKEGLGWLLFLAEVGLGGCLADDMGLGKTVQVLALLLAGKHARGDGDAPRPSLVVAPRSLVYNWLDEAARFAPSLATLDYTGAARKDLRRRFDDHDLVITTYGTLRRDAAALARLRFRHAILDEAQAVKNASSQTAKAARLLRADRRLVLTGTPIENRLAELGSLFEFLNPGMLGRSSRLADLLASGGKDVRADGEATLADLGRALGPFILRRTKEQVLPELPAKTEQTLLVTLDRRQRALYDELRDHYRAHLAQRIGEVGLARSKIMVLEALLRLRQAACHPGLLDPARADEGSAKLTALREQLAEVLDEGHKALVFSQFTSLLALLRRDLDRDGLTYESLDGKTRDRAARVRRFQEDPDCRLFLISLKAGGTGLNLTAADYVFLLDPWWNPAVEAQAVDRTHRIGQERPVFAYRLVARDTVEEKVLELQASKRELAEAVLTASAGGLARLSMDDLELLLGG